MTGVAVRSTTRRVERLRRQYAARRALGRLGAHLLAVVAGAVCTLPLIAGVTADPPTPARLGSVLTMTPVGAYLENSATVGGLVVVITVALALPAAYGLTRPHRRRGALTLVLLAGLVPPVLLFVPLSRLVVTAGLQNDIWPLVIVYPAVTVPIATWLLAGILRGVGAEIEEQAMADGFSRLGAFRRTTLRLATPGIAMVAVLTLTFVAGEFLYAEAFTGGASAMTIGAGLVRAGPAPRSAVDVALTLTATPLALALGFVMDRLCVPSPRRTTVR